MKRIIFAICTILCANVLMAQEQLATLKHNDSISVYYGQNAFVEAYNAAANGDIITLSDGIFNAPSTVQKGITVRGNGAVADTAQRKIGTYFMEIFDVQNLGDSLHFEAEGIYFALFRALSSFDTKLTRCYVDNMENCSGLQAMNCIIKGVVDGSSYINCVMLPEVYHLPHHAICNNCIISGYEYDGYEYESYPLYQFNNCVVIKKGASNTNTILNGAVNYSILIGFTGTNNPASSGNVFMSLSDVFENWDGGNISTDLETYVLKSSVSNSILGLDGREVGIFGGAIPFDWTPTYSVKMRLDFPDTPDENGMLNIDVEFLTE
ncbi:MAG: hypothetical protein U0K83_03025 [Bacteroidales bacterium]|nr:hypothetical protein [Bacteroidales bacterium]